MASSSSNNIEDMMDEKFDQAFEKLLSLHEDHQNAAKSKKK